MQALLEQQLVVGGDGRHRPESAEGDQYAGFGRDLDYRLTTAGHERLVGLGVDLPDSDSTAELLPLRYCIDWTEQAHHLSGAVGRALTGWMLDQGWFERLPRHRALRLTASGARELKAEFGVVTPRA